MKVRYRRRAQLDIENVYDYIAKRNPRAATDVAARIRHAADRLGLWPYLGHAGRAAETYAWSVVGLPYVIVYEIDGAAGEIAIVALFHTAQNRDAP